VIKLRHYQAGSTPAIVKEIKLRPTENTLVALPTGAGKTYCIADLIQWTRANWKTEILVLSHVKEILEQNYKSLEAYLDEPISLNSSMLGRREVGPITVAGIQSVFRRPQDYKKHRMIIVDEAHLISMEDKTMYQKFFSKLPKSIVIGFTATPFRLGTGYIYGKGQMFNTCCYDWTSKEKYQQLIDEGFLSPLTTKRTQMEMDVSNIKMIGGDYSEKALSDEFDRMAVTQAAIKEVMAAGEHRNKWLIFAIDINHAEHIAETLIRNGIPTAPVHSKMHDSGFDRTRTIEGYKNGKYKCVVNVNILTTGFDDPGVDLIAMLRPTSSPVLHVQSLGRGSRIQDGKENCLVLDFAGNTARLGPINDVYVAIKGKGKGGGEPITKDCPKCDSILAPAVKFCPDCGFEFLFKHNLETTATNYDVIDDGKAHWIHVDNTTYELHTNPASPTSVKVSYHCGNKIVSEYICVEHKGFALHKAKHWIKYRGGAECKRATDLIAIKDTLQTPSKILVQKKGKYQTVGDAKFEPVSAI
tara:strand:+ start:1108 stop:2688 length:1581 start_codon:yes stop_codon:yes gene_type:complete